MMIVFFRRIASSAHAHAFRRSHIASQAPIVFISVRLMAVGRLG